MTMPSGSNKTVRPATRRFGRYVAIALASLLGVIVVAGLLIQTGLGKRTLVGVIEDVARSDDLSLTLGELTGSVPFDMRLSQVSVGDREGVWLKAKDIVLTWRALPLLGGHIAVDDLSVGDVTIMREPIPAEATEDEASSGGLPSITASVERLNVGILSLRGDVPGGPATFGISGRLSLNDTADGIAGELTVNRFDEPGGKLAARFEFDPGTGAVDLDAVIVDPADGFVASLLEKPGLAALELSARARGSLDNLRSDLQLTAGGIRLFGGQATLVKNGEFLRIGADFDGDLTALIPAGWEPLLAGPISVDADLDLGSDGAIDVREARLRLPAFAALAAGGLNRATAPDSLQVSARLAHASGETLTIPAGTAPLRLRDFQLDATIEPSGGGLRFAAKAIGDEIATSNAAIDQLTVNLSGTADGQRLLKAGRIVAKLDGAVERLDVGDARLNALIGDRVDLSAGVDIVDMTTAKIEKAVIRAAAFALGFTGTATPDLARGRVSITADDLSRFSEQAGQTLAGRVDITGEGEIGFADGPAELLVSGRLADLTTGEALIDGLIGGTATLTGHVSRNTDGVITVQETQLESAGIDVKASGTALPETLDLALDIVLRDLSRLHDEASGQVHLKAKLAGTVSAPELTADGTGSDIVLRGQPLLNPVLALEAELPTDAPTAKLTFDAQLKDLPVSAHLRLVTDDDGRQSLDDLRVVAGQNTAEGTLALVPGQDLPDGFVTIRAPDLSELSALLLTDIAGAISGRADIDGGEQGGTIKAVVAANDLAAPGLKLKRANINATVTDPTGQIRADGTINAAGLDTGGNRVDSLTVRAIPEADATKLDVQVRMPGAELDTVARIAPVDSGVNVSVATLTGRHAGIAVKLAEPADIQTAGGTTTIGPTVLTVGGGRIRASGRVAETIDMALKVENLPLSIINAVAPGTGAGGTLNADVKVSGRADNPRAEWRVGVRKVTAAAAKQLGVPAISVDASGQFADNSTTIDARVGGVSGLDIRARGRVPAAPTGALDVDVSGGLPFSMISRAVSDAGASLTGKANIALKVAGPAGSPRIAGSVTTSGATATHVDTGTVIRDIAAKIDLSGNRVVVSKLTGRFDKGGRINAGGTLDYAAPGMPANLTLAIRDGRYVDGNLVSAEFEAELKLTGRVADAPAVVGKVTIGKAEINIPEKIPGGAAALGVKHQNAPETVRRQDAIIAPKKESGGGASKGTIDLVVSAPSKIFVRGRGLDSELGGRLSMKDRLSSPSVTGGFQMRRGRLELLSRRIEFTRGIVKFGGDFDPLLDFAGTTRTSDATITIAVAGSASDPDFRFTSSPELPQDEVLARFLFDRGVDKLSAVQIAQLAASIATLTGRGGGPGVLDRAREGLGVDRLDATTDDKGKTQVQAGKYVTDNVYLGVKQGTGKSSTKVTIDLDVTDNVKARGEVGNDGETKAGIFFERDY